uniref:Uncharacterized protein n=1 Tax=Iridovirus LCIVAC01 TaxID=2506607 RepID=A0A481YPY5_9VIRU|nr:MAG: hypothetical protein LCIVAC01_00610 [Iridovirus LCIVAC01]
MTSAYKRVYSFCETPPGVIKEVECGLGTASTTGEYSYFNSELITNESFDLNFTVSQVLQFLSPRPPPDPFNMFNPATSSSGSTISSSGENLEFINTVAAGRYKFTVHFTLLNTSSTVDDPETTITLGDFSAIPYVNPVTGFFDVVAQFEPFNTGFNANAFIVSMAGVVDLPANAITALLIATLKGSNFEFGTFNVLVEKMAD